jgi:hypothetical protein
MNKDCIENYLDSCGEVMVYMCDGESFELHQHDTQLKNCHILIDKDEEKHVVDYDHIVSLDVHESGRQ